MRKFELIFILVFVQIGFVIGGLIQLNSNTYLITPYINTAFLGSITSIGNSASTIINTLTTITNPSEAFKTQKFFGIDVPGMGIFTLLGSIVSLGLSILSLFVSIFLQIVLMGAQLYTAIILSLIPASPAASFFAGAIGLFLALVQWLIIIYDIFRTIKSVSLGAVNTITYDLDDTAGGALRGRQSYSWKNK